MSSLQDILHQIEGLEKLIEKCDRERKKMGREEANKAKMNLDSLLTTSNYRQIKENLKEVKELEAARDRLWKKYFGLFKGGDKQ
ncbi:unnamed protein product [marine sediment metagenome]|uniref:Uncharacterized protein n=1 Tax=marine sediment metagenome TaxID=412755 RepID=X1I9P5_9ZZZZ